MYVVPVESDEFNYVLVFVCMSSSLGVFWVFLGVVLCNGTIQINFKMSYFTCLNHQRLR